MNNKKQIKDFPRKLSYLIWRDGLRKKELAERLGVSNTHISMLLSGRNKPSPALLFALAEECKISLDWLTDGEIKHEP